MNANPNFFESCKLQINGMAFPLPGEVVALINAGAVVVDIREEIETEIKAFGLENIIYLQHHDFEAKWSSLPTGKPLILADSSGIWSKQYAQLLKTNGFSEVGCLAGGFTAWFQDGFPVKNGKYAELNGPCPCMIKPHERK